MGAGIYPAISALDGTEPVATAITGNKVLENNIHPGGRLRHKSVRHGLKHLGNCRKSMIGFGGSRSRLRKGSQ